MQKLPAIIIALAASLGVLHAQGIPDGWERSGDKGNEPRLVENMLELSGPGSAVVCRVAVVMNHYYKVTVEAMAAGKGVEATLRLEASYNDKIPEVPLDLGADGEPLATSHIIRTYYGKGEMYVEAYVSLSKADPGAKLIIKSISIEETAPPVVSARRRPVTLKSSDLVPELRDFHLQTDVRSAVIVVGTGMGHASAARVIQDVIKAKTGTEISIIRDRDAPIPFTANVLALGNRSSNAFISRLYNRMYTLLDAVYPGKGGYVVRTLHNPFADARNVIFLGGSDAAGTARAVEYFVTLLREVPVPAGQLSVGRLMHIELPEGTELPAPLEYNKAHFWTKVNRGSNGYGWNIIAYNMAMYYMTAKAEYARTAVRLSLQPADGDKDDLVKYDLGSFDDHSRPLSHPYHYFAHNMLLFWDLIEESDVLTDSERLGITRGLAAQISSENMNYPYRSPACVPYYLDRHGAVATFSFYCTARYFNRHYPSKHWTRSLGGVRNRFAYINDKDAYQRGESGNLVRSFSGWITPAVLYLTVTDDKNIVDGGRLSNMFTLYETLFDGPDSMIAASSTNNVLRKIANLTGDGRWLYYAHRTALKPDGVFRVGQSFAPGPSFKAIPPDDILDRFVGVRMPLGMLEHYNYKGRVEPPYDNCYVTISYRNRLGDAGDYVVFDSFREVTQTPYNMNSVLSLRVNGSSILRGYGNYVQTALNGMAAKNVPLAGRVKDHAVFDEIAYIKTTVPEVAWDRGVIIKKLKYALIVDRVTAPDDGNLTVILNWDGPATAEFRAEHNRVSSPTSNVLSLEKSSVHPEDRELTIAADRIRIQAEEAGDYAELSFATPEPISCELLLELKRWGYCAERFQVELDGKLLKSDIENWSEKPEYVTVSLGNIEIQAGRHVLKFSVQQKHEGSTRSWIAIQKAFLKKSTESHICSSGSRAGVLGATNAYHRTNDRLKRNESRSIFTVVAVGDALDSRQVALNAALLDVPERALAFCGEFRSFGSAYTMLIERDGVFAANATHVADLLKSREAVDIAWNWRTGLLEIDSEQATSIQVGARSLAVKPGRNRFDSILPAPSALRALRREINALEPVPAGGASAITTSGKTEELRSFRSARIPGSFERTELRSWCTYLPAIEDTEWDGERALAIATEERVYILDLEGNLLHVIDLGLEVTKVYYWETAHLLLIGLANRTVTAVNQATGETEWTFQARADDSILKKHQTWARTYTSIWGIASGQFPEDRDCAFIGSSSSIELVDAAGKLVKRHVVQFGAVREMLIVKKPDGGKQLLALCSNAAYSAGKLWVLDGKTGRGIRHQASGLASFVPGYCESLSVSTAGTIRTALFYEDFDGDGEKDVMVDHQGQYNLLTVFEVANLAYRPKYQMNLGPGSGAGLCDMPPPSAIVCADVCGSETPEVVYCSQYGILAAVDGKCGALWSTELSFNPEQLCAVSKSGDEKLGTVFAAGGRSLARVDGNGNLVAQSGLKGSVAGMKLLPDGHSVVVLLRTGELLFFRTDG